jgi:hypothetical protein
MQIFFIRFEKGAEPGGIRIGKKSQFFSMKLLFFSNIFGNSFGFIFPPMGGAEKMKQL